MSEAVENAIEEAENKNSKRGPRSRYYFCAGTRTGSKKIFHSVVEAADADEAQAKFKEESDLEAQVCEDGASLGGGGMGFYLAMGTGKSSAQRISVTVTPKQLIQRTTKAFTAEFKGWSVFGSGLKACEVDGEKYTDNELASIEFDELIDKDNKVPKPKLKKREVIRLADLENVRTLSA